MIMGGSSESSGVKLSLPGAVALSQERQELGPDHRGVVMADREHWTAPPPVPHSYRFRDRWSDYRWARADARKGIPLIRVADPQGGPNADSFDAPTVAIRASADAPATLPLPSGGQYAQEDAYDPGDVLVTPYMDALRHKCGQDIAAVYESFNQSCDKLRDELGNAESHRERLIVDKAMAQARFDGLVKSLTEAEATRPRKAEASWSPEMVRVRRERERAEARNTAQEALRKLSADLRAADVDLDHALMAITNRFKRAQAVGWQAFHHYARRESMYLGVLSRKHKRGPEIVRLLRLTGPQLPEWLLETDGKKGA
jgi:hypothetical protein